MTSNIKIIAALGLAVALASPFDAEAGSVVVAADSGAGAMDAEAVRRVFLGRETSVGGAQASVVYQRGGALRDSFDKDVLGRAGAELTSYWSRLVFTGKAKAPEEVANDAAVKAKVASTPGAIGYIDDASVDGSVKVLFTF
ncbi:phosphate ABC transporter substrate-binding protein [Luteimonas sp. SJ-92]|uniref:Phosphate ABC transporter substrate-binding protein n=1 Tax=Luteimonas salinisoli TaxID=2752307 RepID=A0A853JHQ8_9GAMM|nr:phosphate ABC transporter substrate-binding protein [Luteimonas salinisoli]NZA27948.1 phosphate ABC transporter substrate-binding protein [Luteimonas salinisoli]